MKNKFGIICISLGAVMICASLIIFLYNNMESKKADDAVRKVLPEIVRQIENSDTDDEAEVDGNPYIGVLSIPSLNLELPIMADWDMERMKLSPCRYFGSVNDKNMVIAGHNYTNHFGRLHKLSIGDVIKFIDISGHVTTYQVYDMELLPPTAVEDMLTSDADLTLFTCTYSGSERFTVRCELFRN